MTQRNRGKQSSDDQHFAPKWYPIFKEVTDDLTYLLSRAYAMNSALQIVGNRYKLNKRQRIAIQRISANEQALNLRHNSKCGMEDLRDHPIDIDGFNLLILLESALSGA